MSEDIQKLIDNKQQIYNRILDLLEQKYMIMEGGGNIIEGKITILDPPIVIKPVDRTTATLNKLNSLQSKNKFTFEQAALNSFNRIKKLKSS